MAGRGETPGLVRDGDHAFPEIGLGQVRLGQVGALQTGSPDIRPPQAGPGQIGAAQVASEQDRAFQPRPGHVAVLQARTGEVGVVQYPMRHRDAGQVDEFQRKLAPARPAGDEPLVGGGEHVEIALSEAASGHGHAGSPSR